MKLQQYHAIISIIHDIMTHDLLLEMECMNDCIDACIQQQTWELLYHMMKYAYQQRQLNVTHVATVMHHFNEHKQYQFTLDLMQLIQQH